jgi:serine/threonine protein kinase
MAVSAEITRGMILNVNGKKIANIYDLESATRELSRVWCMEIVRDGQKIVVTLSPIFKYECPINLDLRTLTIMRCRSVRACSNSGSNRYLGMVASTSPILLRIRNLDERVAIKEYMPNEIAVRVSDSTVRAKTRADSDTLEQGLNSFLEEARTIARFRHRNIVHVRRFFRLNGTACIVLEYEYGQTLGQYLETHKMGNDQLHDLLSSVRDGLDVVHSRATLHRDLKPSNIILRPDESPVLIDFGASRDFRSRDSRSVTTIATTGYSPPEQYIGANKDRGPISMRLVPLPTGLSAAIHRPTRSDDFERILSFRRRRWMSNMIQLFYGRSTGCSKSMSPSGPFPLTQSGQGLAGRLSLPDKIRSAARQWVRTKN